jgi:hypothetical protein
MSYHFGKTGYVALALQANASTPETTPNMYLPVSEMPDWKTKMTTEWPKEYRGTTSEYTTFNRTKINSEGSVSVAAYPNGGLEHLLYGVLGALSSTQLSSSAAYLHTFTVDQDPPIFTLGVGRDQLNYERFSDCMFGKMDISMEQDKEITIKVEGNGGGGDISETYRTPSYGTERALTWLDLAVSLGGATNCDVKSVDLTIDRGIKSERTACSTAGYNDNVRYITTTTVEGSVEMFFQDYTEYEYWLGTPGATEADPNADIDSMDRVLTITATGENIVASPDYDDQLVITCPKIVYDDATIDMPYDERMTIKFDFKAVWDSTQTTGKEIVYATVQSKLTTVAAPS